MKKSIKIELSIKLGYNKQYLTKTYISELDRMLKFVKLSLSKILFIQLYELKYNKRPSDKEIKTMCVDY